jgi:hypothetical protein
VTAKNKARKVQAATNMAYLTCLQLVRGELKLTPQAPDCLIRAALEAAGVEPQPGTKPCRCPRCDPGDG